MNFPGAHYHATRMKNHRPAAIARIARACLTLGSAFAALLLVACNEPQRPTVNLYRAIHSGDLDQIKRHLYWGADVNQADPNGDFPLHVAARRGRVAIARELLQHGAEVNVTNGAGQTPLALALADGRTQLAQVLVQEGAADAPQSLLFSLVRAGITDRDSLDFLVRQGADVNGRDDAGATPLHIAVRNNQVLLAKRLIDQGADVNLADGEGRTPLAVAMASGSRDVIALLEGFGARRQPMEATDRSPTQ